MDDSYAPLKEEVESQDTPLGISLKQTDHLKSQRDWNAQTQNNLETWRFGKGGRKLRSTSLSHRASSPYCSTDYIRIKENVSCCTSVYYSWTRRNVYVFFTLLLCLTLGAMVFYFIFPRTVMVELYGFEDTLVRICNKTSLVNLTLENVKTVFSISNDNYFPVSFEESTISLSIVVDSNIIPNRFYNFEMVQKIGENCQGRTYCPDMESPTETKEWRIANNSIETLEILMSNCKRGQLQIMLQLKQYRYTFLGLRRLRKPKNGNETYSTQCEECVAQTLPPNESLRH